MVHLTWADQIAFYFVPQKHTPDAECLSYMSGSTTRSLTFNDDPCVRWPKDLSQWVAKSTEATKKQSDKKSPPNTPPPPPNWSSLLRCKIYSLKISGFQLPFPPTQNTIYPSTTCHVALSCLLPPINGLWNLTFTKSLLQALYHTLLTAKTNFENLLG